MLSLTVRNTAKKLNELSNIDEPEKYQKLFEHFGIDLPRRHDFARYLQMSKAPAALAGLTTSETARPALDLLLKRAEIGLDVTNLFPFSSKDLFGREPEIILAAACTSPSGTQFSAEETCLRAALLLGGCITDKQCDTTDYGKAVVDANDAYADEEKWLTAVEASGGNDGHEKALSFGVAAMVTLVTRPGVKSMSAGTVDSLQTILNEILIEPVDKTFSLLSRGQTIYIKRLDTQKFLESICCYDFKQRPALAAQVYKYGQGTSHVTLICTAMGYDPENPGWACVPRNEMLNFVGALDFLDAEPLGLHPSAPTSPETTQDYRATAMPTLCMLSQMINVYFGETSWEGYQNLPIVAAIGGVPHETFMMVLMGLMNARKSQDVSNLCVKLFEAGTNNGIADDLLELTMKRSSASSRKYRGDTAGSSANLGRRAQEITTKAPERKKGEVLLLT